MRLRTISIAMILPLVLGASVSVAAAAELPSPQSQGLSEESQSQSGLDAAQSTPNPENDGQSGSIANPPEQLPQLPREDEPLSAARAALAPLSCEAGVFYSISEEGTLRQVKDGKDTQVGEAGRSSSVNALGIGAGGFPVYAIERSRDASDVVAIRRLSLETGKWEELRNTDFDTKVNLTLVAGAIDLNAGKYYFGGFGNVQKEHSNEYEVQFHLFSFDPVAYENGDRQAIKRVGSTRTGITGSAGSLADNNGDMAFDSDGNLYIVRSDKNSTNIIIATADAIANVSGGEFPSTRTNPRSVSLTEVNGIAFDADGSVYLGNRAKASKYNPSTWEETQRTAGQLSNSTDLASCQSPSTLTVHKKVVGRDYSADQFRLELADASGLAIAEATTEGDQTGIQPQQIGPVPVVNGGTYAFKEDMAAGSVASLDDYSSSFVCTAGNNVLSHGNSSAGTVTIPAQTGPSRAVECTITNEPRSARIIVSKQVIPIGEQTAKPFAGWQVEAVPDGAATLSLNQAQETAGENGEAKWEVRYQDLQAVNLEVSEDTKVGYEFAGGTCTITNATGQEEAVELGGPTETLRGVEPGDNVSCNFINRQLPGSVKWQKTNESGESLLAGSQWQLKAEGNAIDIKDCVATDTTACAGPDKDPHAGAFRVEGLNWSKYQLTETVAPAGYVINPNPTEFTITNSSEANLHLDLGTIRNAMRDAVSLPLTGGTGHLAWIVPGVLLLLVATSVFFIRRKSLHS